MPFPQAVQAAALHRAGGICECRRNGHREHPDGRCQTAVTSDNAEFRYRVAEASGGNDSLFNCEVLCAACYEQALSIAPPLKPIRSSTLTVTTNQD